MSSISAVGSGNPLLQWLQQLSGQGSAQGTAPGAATAGTAPAGGVAQDSDGDNDGSGSGGVKRAGGHHHHGHGLSIQLQSAITSALQSAGSSSDPNPVIQTAIATFLNGSNGTSSATGTTTATTADGSTAASAGAEGSSGTGTVTVNDTTGQQSAFSQLLQSYGVDPSQFHQDLSSAIQTAQSQGGNVDFSQIFQSFPPGSAVDVTG